MQISPFVSPQYSLIVSLAEQLPPRKKKKWVWVRKTSCTTHLEKSMQEEADVKKISQMSETKQGQCKQNHSIGWCVPLFSLKGSMMIIAIFMVGTYLPT